MKKDANRSSRIELRVTPSEKDAIKERAGAYRLSVADYVILKCLDEEGAEITYPPIDEIRMLGQELVHQGTNLNQIANSLNRLVRAGWVDKTTRDDMNKLARELDALVQECSPSIISAAGAVKAMLDSCTPKRRA